MNGTRDALSFNMNPQAEALKKRTFKFGLQVVYFCRELRTTWEGDEFADQLFRSGTRVGANYQTINSPMLPRLLGEANGLWAILNQSQLTARINQAFVN